MSKAIAVATFDYASVDADTKGKLVYFAGRIKKVGESHVRTILEIGEHLSGARDLLSRKGGGDGTWRAWLEAEIGISHQTAANYINAFNRFPSECQIICHSSPTAVYLLSAPEAPEGAAKEAEKQASKGQKITVARAKEILAKFKEVAPKKPPKPAPAAAPEAPAETTPEAGPCPKGGEHDYDEDGDCTKCFDQRDVPDPNPAPPKSATSIPGFDADAIGAEVKAEDAAKAAKVPPADGWGVPIQKHAAKAFEVAPQFDEMLRLLKQVRTIYAKVAAADGGQYLQRPGISRSIKDVWRNEGIENAIKAIEDCKPTFTVCPYEYHAKAFPESKHKHDKKCQLCQGMNWSRPLGKQEIDPKVVEMIKEAFGV